MPSIRLLLKRLPKRILITAGPTREMLDPVRFLSNLSTGEMGYTLAETARRMGYEVTLISGPTMLKPPRGVQFISITSAAELQQACKRNFSKNDALIMTAAVCDFTAAKRHAHKIRRTKTPRLLLKQTPDILAGLAARKGRRIVIGFCLETENWLENARLKIIRKHLDGIVANFYSKNHVPFGPGRITTAFLSAAGKTVLLRQKSKREIAKALLKWLRSLPEKSFSKS